MSRRLGPYAAEFGDVSRVGLGAAGLQTADNVHRHPCGGNRQRGFQDADQEVVRQRVGPALLNF